MENSTHYSFMGAYISCPSCHAPAKFRKVYDHRAGAYIADDCGGCFRASCELYTMSAREAAERYFTLHPEARETRQPTTQSTPDPDLPVTTIPDEYLKWNLAKPPYYADLLKWLQKRFATNTLQAAVELYHIGQRMNGLIEWPMMDQSGNITDIKLQSHINGHREKQFTLHKSLVNDGHISPSRSRACLFGEHILNMYPGKPVSIVEGEKTALVFSIVIPECIWLATGGSNGIRKIKAAAEQLKDRKVVIYPDAGEYGEWKNSLKKMGLTFDVADICEGYPWNTDILDLYFHQKFGDPLPGESEGPALSTNAVKAESSTPSTPTADPPPLGTTIETKLATATAIVEHPTTPQGKPGEPPTPRQIDNWRARLFLATYRQASKDIAKWKATKRTR